MAIQPKMQTFETSGIFHVKAGVNYKVIAVGGGAAGYDSNGGNSGLLQFLNFTADADEDVPVTVGLGGIGGKPRGTGGGASSFGNCLTAAGGTVQAGETQNGYNFQTLKKCGGNGIGGNGGLRGCPGTLNGGHGGSESGGGGGGWGGGKGGTSGTDIFGNISDAASSGGSGYGAGGGGASWSNAAMGNAGSGGDGVVVIMWN